MVPLLIISPMFPPMSGGLPDHTDHLAAALARHLPVAVLTSAGAETDRPFRVCAEVSNWRRPDQVLTHLDRLAPDGPILWQYVPHMYGRGGVNFGIPRLIRRLHQEGRRQMVLAHEIAAPLSWWPHRCLYAVAHRLMWLRIWRTAEMLGISTGAWLEALGRASNHQGRLFLAPSPSNLPVVPVLPNHARRWRNEHGLREARRVLGYFGTIGAGKLFDWVLDAWRAAREAVPETALVVLGADPEIAVTPEERPWFKPLGYLDRPEASAALQALDLLVLPFLDGVSERRSSFMAGLAHGLPVLTTLGPSSGQALRQANYFCGVPFERELFASSAADLVQNHAVRQELAMRARDHYRRHFDWPRLAQVLVDRIAGSTARPEEPAPACDQQPAA